MKIIYSRVFFFLLFSTFLISHLYSVSTSRRTHLFSQGPGVAAGSMGDTFVAGGDDMTVIHYNPSRLMALDRSQIYGAHWFLFDNARYNFIGWSQLFDQSAFALSATQLNKDNIESRKTIDEIPGSISNSQIVITGAYARVWEKYKLNYAGALKYIRFNLANNVGTSWAADIAASRKLFRFGSATSHLYTLDSGINIQNLFMTNMTLKEDSEKFPAAFTLGISASMSVFPRYNKKKDQFTYDLVSLSPEITSSDGATKPSFGFQYRLFDTLFLRAGYKENVTGGFGVIWNDIQFDYAYLPNDFTALHKLGVLYKFGKEVERESQAFTEEYQSAFQKAQRIYQRYYRDAISMVELRKYQAAADLLQKTIPLLPKDNSGAKELLANCRKSLIAESSNEFISQAKSYEARQDSAAIVSAYQSYLKAYDIDPDNDNVKILMDTLYNAAVPSVQTEMDAIKSEYIQKISSGAEPLILQNDFVSLEALVKKLTALDANNSASISLKNRISELKELYVKRVVSQGMVHLQNDQPEIAYGYFFEAARVNPNDTVLKDQKHFAQSLFLKSKKSTLQDKLHAEKLYYFAAAAFATNEQQKMMENLNKLKSFNPVHDFIPELENALRDAGLMRRRNLQ